MALNHTYRMMKLRKSTGNLFTVMVRVTSVE